MRRRGGFTLIEVMVVLAIIGLVATTLSFGLVGRRSGDDDLERLRLVLEAAAERAQVRGTPLAVDFLPQGYRFSSFDTGGNWTPIEGEALFAEQLVSAELAWRGLTIDGRPAAPRLQFGSSMPDFDLSVATPAGEVHLRGRPTGSVQRLAMTNS